MAHGRNLHLVSTGRPAPLLHDVLNVLFFLNGAGPKGPGSFIPAVGVQLQEGLENKGKIQIGH
jgi:hypothetical protein